MLFTIIWKFWNDYCCWKQSTTLMRNKEWTWTYWNIISRLNQYKFGWYCFFLHYVDILKKLRTLNFYSKVFQPEQLIEEMKKKLFTHMIFTVSMTSTHTRSLLHIIPQSWKNEWFVMQEGMNILQIFHNNLVVHSESLPFKKHKKRMSLQGQ